MNRLLKILALVAAFPVSAAAQDIADVVEGRLLTGWRMEDGRHMAAVRLRLAEGWKTYWRAPGDAGIPPRFDWSGSGNLAGFAAHWPVPEVFHQNGMRSIGYGGEVTIPVVLRPQRSGDPIRLVGEMQIGVCEDICIPVTLRLEAVLPVAAPGPGSSEIRTALAARPLTAAEAGVGRVTCAVEPISDGLRVTVAAQMPRLGPGEEAVLEFADPSVWISEAVTTRQGGTLTAVAEMVPADARPFPMARDGVRITVLAAGRAVDIRGCSGG